MSKYALDAKPVETPVATVAAPLKQPTNWGLYAFMTMQSVIMVVVVVVLLQSRNTPPGPGPQPVPPTPVVVITEDVEKITSEAERRFLKNKAEGAERIAADMDAGKITNSNQYAKMAIEYQDAIERDAYAKLIELNQKYVRESGKDGWTAEQLAAIKELQRRKAAGYRSLLK